MKRKRTNKKRVKEQEIDYKEIWQLLEKIIKNELSILEDDLWILEDLKLRKRKLGQWEESRAYHRTLAKVLMTMRKLEKKTEIEEDTDVPISMHKRQVEEYDDEQEED